jgi:mRNA interferase MazF
MTIIIPGTTDVEDSDCFPLRVALGQLPGLSKPTDLLIDQARAISNKRFMGSKHIATLSSDHLRRIEEALRILMSF